jgi:hypothetical protein
MELGVAMRFAAGKRSDDSGFCDAGVRNIGIASRLVALSAHRLIEPVIANAPALPLYPLVVWVLGMRYSQAHNH